MRKRVMKGMSQIRRCREKLKSQRGESLAEVLIALLISTLGMVLLAGMINASVGIITKSKTTFGEYVKEENKLAELLADEEEAGAGTSGTITTNKNLTANDITSIDVICKTNETLGNHKVVAYKIPTPAKSAE